MSDNFQIGSSNAEGDCWLKFHQYTLFDTTKFTTSGPIYWDNTEKCFYVFTPPNPEPISEPEVLIDNTSVFSSKGPENNKPPGNFANLGKKSFRNK